MRSQGQKSDRTKDPNNVGQEYEEKQRPFPEEIIPGLWLFSVCRAVVLEGKSRSTARRRGNSEKFRRNSVRGCSFRGDIGTYLTSDKLTATSLRHRANLGMVVSPFS